MQIVKTLKEKSAESLVVAIVLGFLVYNAVAALATKPTDWLSGGSQAGNLGSAWNNYFWRPLVALVIGVIILEILLRVYAWLMRAASGKR
jgi:hypothetical protein